MASAPESNHPVGTNSGAGVTPVLLTLGLLLAAACGDDAQPAQAPTHAVAASRAVADPAQGVTTELDGAAIGFGDALLAELAGDGSAARAAYEQVLAAPDAPPLVTARAAMHLAQMEARAGKNRRALDLAARAAALAPSDLIVAEGLAQLHSDVLAASGAAAGAGEIRGPRLGAPLPGVDPRVAADFAAAERALGNVHKLHPRPLIEALSASIRAKEDATEEVVAKYRAVAEHGGLAQIAASYRAGSLYYDLALGLLFELPPELDPAVAAGLRRTLRGRALAYLHKAVTDYKACLAAAPLPDAELWRLQAEADLREALAILGES